MYWQMWKPNYSPPPHPPPHELHPPPHELHPPLSLPTERPEPPPKLPFIKHNNPRITNTIGIKKLGYQRISFIKKKQ